MLFKLKPGYAYSFVYRNHADETAIRHVVLRGLEYGEMRPYYPEPTWLLRCYDLDRGEERCFDINKIIDPQALDISAYVAKKAGQALEQAHPFGYRSTDSEP